MGKSICFVALHIYPLLKKTPIKFIGGAEVQQHLIGEELARRGYSVTYITFDHGQGIISRIGSFEIVSAFNPSKGIPVLRFIYPRLVKIWQALNRTNANIYYVRCASMLLGVVEYWARLNKKKVIFLAIIFYNDLNNFSYLSICFSMTRFSLKYFLIDSESNRSF